ncbi:MAG: phospholipase D-like domain-containing protein [Nanoarchaeota archaeon]
MRIVLYICVVLLIAIGACDNNTELIPQENGSIVVFFCPRDNCSAIVHDAIALNSDISCAFYDLSDKAIVDILVEKNARVAIDDEESFGLGTPVKAKGIMHDKFCIFERQIVLTGSYNPTTVGEHHRNNIVIINSAYLAKNYLDEFDELERNVVQSKKQAVAYPLVNVSGILIENYFCPEDACEEHVVAALQNAKESIYFMTYSFTSYPIAGVLIEKKDDIEIRGLFDSQQVRDYSMYFSLEKASIPVRIDNQPYLMHNKVFIIDNETVITGSFNPTKNANENNDENIIIIHDAGIAQQYVEEFEKWWGETFK